MKLMSPRERAAGQHSTTVITIRGRRVAIMVADAKGRRQSAFDYAGRGTVLNVHSKVKDGDVTAEIHMTDDAGGRKVL